LAALVDETDPTGVMLGLQRQGAAGHEPGDARHCVQRQHEQVGPEDLNDVAQAANGERRLSEPGRPGRSRGDQSDREDGCEQEARRG
jgi:hypothetical protein